MWVPKEVINWFSGLKADADSHASVTRDALISLREELSAVRAERDALKLQQAVDRTHSDWFRLKINALELERAGLIEKAYQIKLPAIPEFLRPTQPIDPNQYAISFDDVGDDVAKILGLPSYRPPTVSS